MYSQLELKKQLLAASRFSPHIRNDCGYGLFCNPFPLSLLVDDIAV